MLCMVNAVAEEDGCDWGVTVDVSQVHYNRDLLKDCHARGGTCPWCPPGSATYVILNRVTFTGEKGSSTTCRVRMHMGSQSRSLFRTASSSLH